MSVSVPLLTAQIIAEHGSEEQQAELLPELANGSIFHVGLGINNASLATIPINLAFLQMRVAKKSFLMDLKLG